MIFFLPTNIRLRENDMHTQRERMMTIVKMCKAELLKNVNR